MSVKQRQDLLAALLFLVAAALIIWLAIPYGVQEPKKVKFAALNPSYYPRLVGYCLMAFGALLLLRQFFQSRQSEGGVEFSQHKPRSGVVLLVTVIILGLWYWLLPSLGFVLTSMLALVLLQLVAGERKPLAITLIATLVPGFLYLFFTKVANIPIPGGLLDPWLLQI